MTALSFFEHNLAGAAMGPETRDAVREAHNAGAVVLGEDGWPALCWQQPENVFLDTALPLGAIDEVKDGSGDKVILFGLGLGHTARALRASGVPVAAIFEPQPGIIRHFFEQGPSDLGPIPVITHLPEFTSTWSELAGNANRMRVFITPGYATAFARQRLDLKDQISDLLLRSVANEETLKLRGKTWVNDIVENARQLCGVPSAHYLAGAFEGVPAFIVGAGPSLAKNVQLLREAGKKGIVIAVNTSARALDKAGVVPQMLACLESLDVTPFMRDLSFIDDVVRVFGVTGHPNLFRTGHGPLLTLYEHLPQIARPLEGLFGKPGIPVCGSVSTAAFSLAQRMGCSPIVLVGQDLAFTGGRAYAPGTPFENSTIAVAADGKTLNHEWCENKHATHHDTGNNLVAAQDADFVDAYGGEGMVPSTTSFSQVRMWLERCAEVFARLEQPPELVNATEGGARVRGFVEKNLAEVLANLPERDITPTEIVAKASELGELFHVAQVSAFLKKQQEGAGRVAAAARQLSERSAAADADDASDMGRLNRMLGDVTAAEQELRLAVMGSPWVDAWAVENIERAKATPEGDESGNDLRVSLRSEQRLGQAIESAAHELYERLESGRAQLEKN